MIRLKKLISENVLNESTRSQIGYIDNSGNIISTYVHYDGYPDWVGKIAKKHYSGGKVKQLLKIDGGNGISSLEPKMDGGKGHSFDNRVKGQTTFYGRDRGETGGKFMRGKLDKVSNYIKDAGNQASAEYVYLYNMKDKKWYYADTYEDKELKLLESVKKSVNENKDAKKLIKVAKATMSNISIDFSEMIENMESGDVNVDHYIEYAIDRLRELKKLVQKANR